MLPSESQILKDMATSIPGVIYQFLVRSDGSWYFPYVSKGIESLFEVTQEEACRDADVLTRCIIDEDRPSHRQSIEHAVKNLIPWHHEHRIRTKSGVMKWILGTALPSRLEDGGTLWNGILTDITEIIEQKHTNANQTTGIDHIQAVSEAESNAREQHYHLAQQVRNHPLVNDARLKLRVLIVEDDTALRNVLVRILAHFGHDVRGVEDGIAMGIALAESPADIIVLDINLPGEDGVQIARRLRKTSSCGIIMMTGRGISDDKLNCYQCGVDIFFGKPVDPQELHAVIVNLGRRLSPPIKSGWHFDASRSQLLTPRKITIPLSYHQAIVLNLLINRPGESVPRTEILTALGHPDDEYAYQRLETLLSRFRAKIRSADPESELPIRARHGMGYAFLAEVER